MTKRTTLKWMAASAVLACASTAWAQDTIKIVNVVRTLGAQAPAPGTYFRDGVELAVKEINAAAAFWAKRSSAPWPTRRPNPGVAKGLAAKGCIDDGAFAMFGPVLLWLHHGQSMTEKSPSRDPQLDRRRSSSDHSAGQPLRVSHCVRPVVLVSETGQVPDWQVQDALP
jgi:hypothetical protein